MPNHNYFQKLWLAFSSYLNQPRSPRYTQYMQLLLLLVTVIVITFSLMFPSVKNFEIDLRPDGPWSVSKNAPEDIIAITDVDFLMQKSYAKAQEEATRQTPIHFTRDFGALTEIARSRNLASEQTANPSFQEMLQDDIQNLRVCRYIAKKRKRCTSMRCQPVTTLARSTGARLERTAAFFIQ